MRWIHPVCGEIVPDQFLPAAAQSQVGRDIDEWALKRACEDIGRLPREGDAPVCVEVNIGQRMLESEKLTADCVAYAASAGVHLGQIGLNVSERVLATSRSGLHALRTLRERGVKVFVDGFGSGRVPLERLASLPIDGIGVDRSFIARITTDMSARAMCKSVVSIAHAFGLRASAAGIETAQQLEFVTNIGCDAAQGKLLRGPMDVASLNRLSDVPAVMHRVAGKHRS